MNDGRDHHGHGHGDRHEGHRHDGHPHHHHHDGHPHHGPGDGGHRGGPGDTEFLDLEISKVVQAQASSLTREAAANIIRGAIEARLRERLGPQLEAVGRMVADELIDDFEANLDIEGRIAARRERRRATEGRVHEILRSKPAQPPPPRRKRR